MIVTTEILRDVIVAQNGNIRQAVINLGGIFEVGSTARWRVLLNKPKYQTLYASFPGHHVGSRIKIAIEYAIPESNEEVDIMLYYLDTADVNFKIPKVHTYEEHDAG